MLFPVTLVIRLRFCIIHRFFKIILLCPQFCCHNTMLRIHDKFLSEYVCFFENTVICKTSSPSDRYFVHFPLLLSAVYYCLGHKYRTFVFELLSYTLTNLQPFITPITDVATVPSTLWSDGKSRRRVPIIDFLDVPSTNRVQPSSLSLSTLFVIIRFCSP